MSAFTYADVIRRRERTIRLLKDGMSAREIAKATGQTRNAVIGFCNRQGINIGLLNGFNSADPVIRLAARSRHRKKSPVAEHYPSAADLSRKNRVHFLQRYRSSEV